MSALTSAADKSSSVYVRSSGGAGGAAIATAEHR
jgi:hypothetical protein